MGAVEELYPISHRNDLRSKESLSLRNRPSSWHAFSVFSRSYSLYRSDDRCLFTADAFAHNPEVSLSRPDITAGLTDHSSFAYVRSKTEQSAVNRVLEEYEADKNHIMRHSRWTTPGCHHQPPPCPSAPERFRIPLTASQFIHIPGKVAVRDCGPT